MNFTVKPTCSYQQVVTLASLHVVNRDFSDEFPCSGVRVIHKIGVNSTKQLQILSLPAHDTCYEIIDFRVKMWPVGLGFFCETNLEVMDSFIISRRYLKSSIQQICKKICISNS